MENIIKKTGYILMKIGYYLSMILVFLLMLFYQFAYYENYDDFILNDYIYQIPFVIVCIYFYLYKRKFRYFSFGLIVISIYLLYQCILLNFEILNVYTIAIFNVFLLYLIYLIEKNKEYIVKINYLKIFVLIIISYYSLFYSERLYMYSKINYIEKEQEYSFYLETPTDLLYAENLEKITGYKIYNAYQKTEKIDLNRSDLFKNYIDILNIKYSIKEIINYEDALNIVLVVTVQSYEYELFKYRNDDFLTKMNYKIDMYYTQEEKKLDLILSLCSIFTCLQIENFPENKKNELIELNNKIREKYNIKELY